MNKRINFFTLMLTAFSVALLSNCTYEKEQEELEVFTTNSLAQIKQLATQLKSTLVSSMQEGGPGHAIDTCKIQAPTITDKLNKDSTVEIRRTSLKIRNPNNAPDDWEQKVLSDFNNQLASGVSADKLIYSEKIEYNGTTALRLMKAIPTQAVCLSCHGNSETMSGDVQEKLTTHYPNDRATGYSVGELRGAFSVTQTMNRN